MVRYCCAIDCKNNGKDTLTLNSRSQFRHFLKFHEFPKDSTTRDAWLKRVGRDPKTIRSNQYLAVCSDHFFDEDFQVAGYLQQKLLQENEPECDQETRVNIYLKPNAVPNTNQETGEYVPFKGRTASSIRQLELGSRKRKRMDTGYIQELIDENSTITARSSIITKARCVHPKPAWLQLREADSDWPELFSSESESSADEELVAVEEELFAEEGPVQPANNRRMVQFIQKGRCSKPQDPCPNAIVPDLEIADDHDDEETAMTVSPVLVATAYELIDQVDPPEEADDDASQPDSELSITDDDSNDSNYCPDSDDQKTDDEDNDYIEYEDETEADEPEININQFDGFAEEHDWLFVSTESLKLLLTFCVCPRCETKLEVKDIVVSGFSALFKFKCSPNCGEDPLWTSSPMAHKRYLANIMIPACFYLAGVRHTAVSAALKSLKGLFPSHKTWNKNLNNFIVPRIHTDYESNICEIMAGYRENRTTVKGAGDGQYDSPHHGKYCDYTLMDAINGLFIGFSIIQLGQYSQTSQSLEMYSSRQCLREINSRLESPPMVIVTDRHGSVRKMLREEDEFANMEHSFDCWHFSKSLRKRLRPLVSKYPVIGKWIDRIVNHYWWSCENCGNNGDRLVQLFHSVLFHVINVHHWSSTLPKWMKDLKGKRPYPIDFNNVKQCSHQPLLVRDVKEIEWMEKGSEAYIALFTLLTDTMLCNDMRHCKHFLHTWKNESYHQVSLIQLPKRVHFSLKTRITKRKLVALEVNENAAAQCDEGQRTAFVSFSRQQQKYIKCQVPTKDLSLQVQVNGRCERGIQWGKGSYC